MNFVFPVSITCYCLCSLFKNWEIHCRPLPQSSYELCHNVGWEWLGRWWVSLLPLFFFWRDAPAHWGLWKSLPVGSRMSLPCLKLGLLGDIFAKKSSIYNESWQWLVSSEALDLHTKLMKCPFFSIKFIRN